MDDSCGIQTDTVTWVKPTLMICLNRSVCVSQRSLTTLLSRRAKHCCGGPLFLLEMYQKEVASCKLTCGLVPNDGLLKDLTHMFCVRLLW